VVYLIWSGDFSRSIAYVLYQYLPKILPNVEFFYSPEGIKKGDAWNTVLCDKLKTANFGLACVTKSNIKSSWLCFEAGAILCNKNNASFSSFYVDITSEYLIGSPLLNFQSTEFNKNDFNNLIKSIVEKCDPKFNYRNRFNDIWPELESQIKLLIKAVSSYENYTERQLVNSQPLIVDVLRTACKSIIYPQIDFIIRAVIVKLDYQKKIRTTIYSYNARPDPENVVVLDLDFGIIGHCIKSKHPVYQRLYEGHNLTYPKHIQGKISPELRGVIAAPIFDYRDNNHNFSAVLAFDLLEKDGVKFDFDSLNFKSREFLDIAQSWAEIISAITDFK
jgi:hypothetical protein